MPSVDIDDQLWTEFLQFSDQLGIKDPGLFLAQWLRQRLKTEQQAEGRYQLVANAIVINPEGQILIVGNQYERSSPLFWGLPGGSVEIGETIQQTLTRELYEETGLEAVSIGRLVSVSQLFLGPHATGLLAFMYQVDQWHGVLSTQNEAPGGLVKELKFISKEIACDLLSPNFAIPLRDWLSSPDHPTRLYWKDNPGSALIHLVGQD